MRDAGFRLHPFFNPGSLPAGYRTLLMLPYWIELKPEDLIHGTAVLAMALTFLIFSLFSSAGRA